MSKCALDNFASNVLTDDKLQKLMESDDFKSFRELKQFNGDMDFELANKVAKAIKKWAISMGATHYTHWFFPLTGKYAEKHICFLDYDKRGNAIKAFNGMSLIKGEIDASSFPSGGERLTFEARGYTVWDYSSPVFIKTDETGNKVLYIPTAFCTYNGTAVDEKTPLLRATDYLSKEATKLLNSLGYNEVKSVVCNVGCEQEYFLIKKDLFDKRKDLIFAGRTLLGAETIKNQESSNHYLGQIKPRVSSFMHDLNKELWKLGIMAKIQHNEVAPSQYEIVVVYNQANIVADQNSLLMEVMNSVANKHEFSVLFHEKPFKKVNGSGKHNNWSISTNTGINLLDQELDNQLLFLLFFTSVISAIHKHYDLLKLSILSLSNEFRLGGHEAPPSVISVFIGEEMTSLLNDFVNNNVVKKQSKSILDMKTSRVAKLYQDCCDRNRTSPIAFTGNKFEFRMVGASQSIAFPNTIIATIVADELRLINEKLNGSKDKDDEIKNIISDNIKNHSPIIFNGNCYDEQWKKESESRGLIDYYNCVECYGRLLQEDNIRLFENSGVLSKVELKIRHETYLSKYINDCIIEAKTLCEMCNNQVFFNIERQIGHFAEVNSSLNLIGKKVEILERKITNLIDKYSKMSELIHILEGNIKKVYFLKLLEEKVNFCNSEIKRNLECINKIYEEIEPHLAQDFKPFPNYDDLLF